MAKADGGNLSFLSSYADATGRLDDAGAASDAGSGVLVRAVGAAAKPAVLRLQRGSCVVGTSPECDLVLSERSVSRQHARLTLDAKGIIVEDLGSTNGTFWLGQRVHRMLVSPGTTLLLGKVQLALEHDDEFSELEPAEADAEAGVIAASAAMRKLIAIVQRMRHSNASVLVTGESGVGKELIAQAIHERSALARGPFVAVNCGALARDLIASELFGHRRGAFTGADAARDGAFVTADGGTLLLDEIGELPLEVQPALLRVLERGEVRPVGGDHSTTVRVRVIAATHRDLREEIAHGRFREDLFYRLAVVNLHVPPLRDRREDIEPLARAFARAAGLGEVPAHVMARWKSDPWHGNVRELRNAVNSYAALGVAPTAWQGKAPPAPFEIDLSRPYGEQKDEICDNFTRAYLTELVKHSGGNLSKAARTAGLDRSYLGRLLARYGLANR